MKYFGIGIGIWETFSESESESYLGTSTCQGGVAWAKSGRFVVLQVGIYPSCYWASLCVCMAWPGLASSVPTYVVLPAPTATDNKEKSEIRLGSRYAGFSGSLGGFGPSSALVANGTVAGSGG
jgi:hypothetical protein